MALQTKTQYGSINISNEAIISTVRDAVLMCYGVVGFAKRHVITASDNGLMEGDMLKHSIFIREEKKHIELDIYVYISENIKITEVLSEIQKRVKYVLEKTFEMKFSKINVFAKGIRRID